MQTISINGGKPLESIIDKIRNTIGYRDPLPENVALHDWPVQEFFFQYDGREKAEAVLRSEPSIEKGFALQKGVARLQV